MTDSFKNIEEHFKKSIQDYTIPNGTANAAGFASVMTATNKKLFFKFIPKRFNIYYLSAAITVSSATALVLVTNEKEPELIKTNEIVVDSSQVNTPNKLENTAIYSDTLKNYSEAEIATTDTLNLTPPSNPVVSSSKEIIPETIETMEEQFEESSVNNPEPVQEEENMIPEAQSSQTQKTKVTIDTKPVQIDSTVIIDTEDVLIKNSETQVKIQKVKKKGR